MSGEVGHRGKIVPGSAGAIPVHADHVQLVLLELLWGSRARRKVPVEFYTQLNRRENKHFSSHSVSDAGRYLRTAPYCSVLVCMVQYCNGTVPGTSAYVRDRVGMGCGNLRDAIFDARAKEARRLSQIRLRLGDDLHRRERG